jgi:hypothetical protein
MTTKPCRWCARLFKEDRRRAMERLELLKKINFGSQVAEDEVENLQNYFVQTDQWSRIFGGEIDIVRGEKGAGKSAIYLLLNKHNEELFDRNILIASGENPRGNTVFKDLISDPPASENEFVLLWKLYLLVLISHQLRGFGIETADIKSVYRALEEAKLLEAELNLSSVLRQVQAFARRLLNPKSFETELSLDPTSGLPTGIIGRISLAEPSGELRDQGISSVDGMFEKVNSALGSSGLKIWVLLDRLDVAFAESHKLEANAIRALMRVYSDLRGQPNISLKIFLREDIWNRVTAGGLREASHITRYELMAWTPPMLMNLAMRRLLSNDILVSEMKIDKDEILSSAQKQEELFLRIFPSQVEQGPQKVTTFNWMVTRCSDGTGKTAPREFIHLLRCIRDEEIKRLERGGPTVDGEQLFDRSVFKLALPTVSSNRLNTYLYAEYPTEREFLEKLEGQKAEQNPETLASIWGVDRDDALKKAGELVALGFFEQRGTRLEPTGCPSFIETV